MFKELFTEAKTKWEYVCPHCGNKVPLKKDESPEYITRPCPKCGYKMTISKVKEK